MLREKPDKALSVLPTVTGFKRIPAEGAPNWRHSGFNVYCGNAIWPHNEEGLENVARYTIRASFWQERMTYVPAHESSDCTAKVICESKDSKKKETFDALDWLALLTTHIPNRGEQMVRYYGYYSNKSRGMKRKAGIDTEVLALIDSDVSRKAFRKNWARLIAMGSHLLRIEFSLSFISH